MTKLFLDAGHGGKDCGATRDGVKESDINLALTEKIAAVADNMEIKHSRETDVFVGINERAKMANAWGADVFVSIHVNAAANETANGIETLCYSDNGKSYALAKDMQAALIKGTGATDRGVKIRPDLGVLRLTKMPAILIEIGFISNNRERDRLVSVPYQDKLAEIIASVITK